MTPVQVLVFFIVLSCGSQKVRRTPHAQMNHMCRRSAHNGVVIMVRFQPWASLMAALDTVPRMRMSTTRQRVEEEPTAYPIYYSPMTRSLGNQINGTLISV
ncbi:hypothetical protein BGZ63DRAFT_387170 [Mariannaea sp. PMI_226]|nr:hypothetical protein BGZ63DRAFT_387170 [Mariannaea sp. PMI_226]